MVIWSKPPAKRLNAVVDAPSSRAFSAAIRFRICGEASMVGCSLTLLYFLASPSVGSTVRIGAGARSTMKPSQFTPISDFPVWADHFSTMDRDGWSGCRQSIGSRV